MTEQRFLAYPAILDDKENTPGVYSVSFPDVPEAITYGNGKAEALMRASQILGTMLLDYQKLPIPTPLAEVQRQFPDAVVTIVATDLAQARQETHPVRIKKNTTIPARLAQQAEAAGINFSQTLTEALQAKLASQKNSWAFAFNGRVTTTNSDRKDAEPEGR